MPMKGILWDRCFRWTWAWWTWACRSIALHCVGVGDDNAHVVDDCATRGALDAEGCQPRVALVAEDSHCFHVLDELNGLGELVEERVELEGELDDAWDEHICKCDAHDDMIWDAWQRQHNTKTKTRQRGKYHNLVPEMARVGVQIWQVIYGVLHLYSHPVTLWRLAHPKHSYGIRELHNLMV